MHFKLLALSALLLSTSNFALASDFQANPYNDDAFIEREKCDPNRKIENEVTIVSTADGDTVNVRTKRGVYAIRMIGIDTPETHYFGQTQGKWGDIAADRLAEFLPAGAKVRLEFAPGLCDSYGRVLAHIFKGKMHVNRQMAKEGLAVNYCMYPSVAYCEEIGELAAHAIEERLGMFSDSSVELPYDFRRRISERAPTSFVGSLKTKKVYRPGQQERTPVPERIFFSREESVKAPYFIVD